MFILFICLLIASLSRYPCICNKKVKKRIAVSGIPSHSYGTSLAIWDHTVLPATRHKWTHPAFTPASKPVLDLPIRRDGRLSWLRLPGNAPAGNRTRDLSITSPTPYRYTNRATQSVCTNVHLSTKSFSDSNSQEVDEGCVIVSHDPIHDQAHETLKVQNS